MGNRTRGEDDGGEYVIWQTKSTGTWNKKYISGPLEGVHKGYTPGGKEFETFGPSRQRDGFQDPNSSNSSSSGGCYIATATLTGGGTETQLNWLRSWRDQVLTKTSLGRRLEGYYDWTGPTVAEWVANNQLLASTFLYPFVKPAVWLAQRRAMSGAFKPVLDLSIYLIFLLGLAYGSLVYWIRRVFDRA